MLNNKLYNFYRPIWTCGRYDAVSESAIYFNLITGISYFFEEYSAIVVGKLLATPRNDEISVEKIALETGIERESLISFLYELEQCGLLTKEQTTPELTRKKHVCNIHKFSANGTESEKSALLISNAERAYAARCKKSIITVMLELTYRCSERCIHCYNPGAARNSEEVPNRNIPNALSLDDYKRIINELYDEGVVRVCLSGGDPFSNPLAWNIIEYLFNKEIAIEIFTNAQALVGNEERLASFFPCDVGISLYSDKEDIHDYITQTKGSFRKSMKVLERLSELNVPLVVKCCVMRPNVGSYLGVSKIAQKYGAVFQLECSIFDSVDGDTCVSHYLRLTEEQMDVVLCDKNNPLYVGKDLEQFGRKDLDMDDNGCLAGFQNFCITPNGNIIPCCSFHTSIGNLKKQSVADVLVANPALEWWRNLKLHNYDECGRYDYCGFCKLCPGLNFAQHGTPLKAAENNCYTAKVRYNLAKRMKYGYDPLHGETLEKALALVSEESFVKIKKIQTTSHFDKTLI